MRACGGGVQGLICWVKSCRVAGARLLLPTSRHQATEWVLAAPVLAMPGTPGVSGTAAKGATAIDKAHAAAVCPRHRCMVWARRAVPS